MSTTVYIPAQKSIGESLGEGVGAGLSRFAEMAMKKQEQEMQMAKIQKVQDAIKSAPDANTAYGLINKLPLQTPQDMEHALAYVRQIFPPTDKTPHEVSVNNPDGTVTKKFIPRDKLTDFESTSTQKAEDYYTPANGGKWSGAGSFPRGSQPKGAVTAEEIRLNKDTTDRPSMAAEMSNTLAQNKLYNSNLGSLLNAKKTVGQDGGITFDFGGDKVKETAYRTAMENYDEYRTKYKGDLNKAAVNALKDAGAFNVKPDVPAAAPVKKPSLWERITGPSIEDKPAEKTAPKDAAKPAPSAAAPGKFIEGQVYTDANGNKAKYVKGKWEPVK